MTLLVAGSNMTISGGGLTATPTTNALGYARTDSSVLQKIYCEITMGAVGPGGIGFANVSETGYLPGTVNSFGTTQDGNCWHGAYNYDSDFGGAWANGDRFGFAVDLAVGWWCRKNGGAWNIYDATANPATGVHPFPFPSGGGPWLGYISLDAVTANATLNAGASAFVDAIPSGFIAWEEPLMGQAVF